MGKKLQIQGSPGVEASPVGIEPTTNCLEGRCSIRLSYGDNHKRKARRTGWGTVTPGFPEHLPEGLERTRQCGFTIAQSLPEWQGLRKTPVKQE